MASCSGSIAGGCRRLRIFTEVSVITTSSQGNRPHIVVVSEDSYTLRRLRELLAVHSVLLHLFLSTKDLLAGEALGDSDCLVLESRFSDMDGLALFSDLKQNFSSLPPTIILAGGDESGQRAVEAMKAGAFDYIEKPFTSSRMVLALNAAMKTDLLRAR